MTISYHKESKSARTQPNDARIHNVRVDKHFTTTFNSSSQDKRLSFSARGLLWYLLSLPENWTLYRRQLTQAYTGEAKGNGRDAIDRMLKELISLEYVDYVKCKDEKGFWIHRYDVYPVPKSKFKIMFPDPDYPEVDNPAPVHPAPDNPPYNIKDPITKNPSYKEPKEKHICPDGVNACFSGKKDKFGHPEYIAPPLKGTAMEEYGRLSYEQKEAYKLIMNVPPANDKDERFNQLSAARIASMKSTDQVHKAIIVYKQRLERGEKPKKMGAYLTEIFNAGYEPVPEHFEKNVSYWRKNTKLFPEGSFTESRDYVSFPRVDKEVSFRMSPEVFMDQLKRIYTQMRETHKGSIEE